MADVPPSPSSDERSSYYLDQLFMIGVCGALAGVTLVLWQSGSLGTLLHRKFALAVGIGGIGLLTLVVLRAVAVWTSVDAPAEKEHEHEHGPDCDHSHGHGHDHAAPKPAGPPAAPPPVAASEQVVAAGGGAAALTLAPPLAHGHAHSHSHSHAHSHAHGDHEHGGAPWRYVVLLLPVVLYVLMSQLKFSLVDKPAEPLDYIRNFFTIFFSILCEALPFIVLGSVIAGVLEEFLPSRYLTAIIPKNRYVAIAVGGLLGLVFPMCECGIIPIMRRLLRKGLPLSCCITYLLAGPIINVVVILSTVVAFTNQNRGNVPPDRLQMDSLWMPLFRAGLGYVVAVVTGLLVEWLHRRHGDSLLTPLARPSSAPAPEETAPRPARPLWERFGHVTETSLGDFVDITVFLLLGALMSATVRMFLAPERIAEYGSDWWPLAIVLMMGLAVILCLCSEADAFVAASFSTLRPSAKVAFLVLGPMIDFKLYAMYTRIFRPRLIFTIYGAVALQVLVYSVGTHYFWQNYAEYLVSPVPVDDELDATQRKEMEDRALILSSSAVVGMSPDSLGAQGPLAAGLAALKFANEEAPEISFLRLENATNNAQLRSYYEGKLVSMTGRFSGSEQAFTLLRYKMNCCVADATPLRAVGQVEKPADGPGQALDVNGYRNQWVKVTARLHFEPAGGGWAAVLKVQPTARKPVGKLIEHIDAPSNPYIE